MNHNRVSFPPLSPRVKLAPNIPMVASHGTRGINMGEAGPWHRRPTPTGFQMVKGPLKRRTRKNRKTRNRRTNRRRN